jgi:hypothetical protein
MGAEFLYPAKGNYSTENDGQMINVYDQLYLEYTSDWPSANLTFYCAVSSSIYFVPYGENPLADSGIYYFGPVKQLILVINEWPIVCNYKLTEVGGSDSLDGQQFWVTSNAASSTTFSPTVTSTTSASTRTSTSTQTTDTTTTVLSSSASSSAVTATQAATETQTSTPSTSPGLSAGAAAGIGVGVGLAVFILAAAILFMFLRRRKAARAASPDVPAENPPSDAIKSENAAKPEYYSQHQQQDPQEMEAISPAELENGQSVPAVRHELSG